jgi:hypothetical protein
MGFQDVHNRLAWSILPPAAGREPLYSSRIKLDRFLEALEPVDL